MSTDVNNISAYDRPSYEFYRVDLFVSSALLVIATIVYVLDLDVASMIILLTLMVLFFVRGTLGMYRFNRAKQAAKK